MVVTPRTQEEIQAMRTGGKILAEALEMMREVTIPGITTAEIDAKVREFFQQKGVEPAFLGYYGFAGAVCISVNEEIIHGVPKQDKVIQAGDIVSLDCGVLHNGMVVDSARTFGVGEISEEARLLIERTKKSFFKGVSKLKDGAWTGDFGQACEEYLDKFGYGIIRDYAGHGVGRAVHEEPTIPNYGTKGTGFQLKEGMTIALEPMVTLGAEETYVDADDDWTVLPVDHSLSAHYEHTVLITKNGVEILTQL